MKWLGWLKDQSSTNMQNQPQTNITETINADDQASTSVINNTPSNDNPTVVLSSISSSITTEGITNNRINEQQKPPDYESILPPDYQTATQLPSYEEAERTKLDALDGNAINGNLMIDPITGIPYPIPHSTPHTNLSIFGVVCGEQPGSLGNHSNNVTNLESGTARDPRRISNTRNSPWARFGPGNNTAHPNATNNSPRFSIFPFGFASSSEWRNVSREVVGTDTAFLTSFLISFIFNWIGFLFAICVSQTIAGRCGALSGFGLSIIKWTFIVKHSLNYTPAEIWLWWLLIILGALLFFKGCVQYLQYRPYVSTTT